MQKHVISVMIITNKFTVGLFANKGRVYAANINPFFYGPISNLHHICRRIMYWKCYNLNENLFSLPRANRNFTIPCTWAAKHALTLIMKTFPVQPGSKLMCTAMKDSAISTTWQTFIYFFLFKLKQKIINK